MNSRPQILAATVSPATAPFAAVALLALAGVGLAQDTKTVARRELPADRARGAAAIAETKLRDYLGVLASPEFEGRGTGQEGFRKAAEYVSAHFEKLGLKPAGDDGTYLQAVPWTLSTPKLAEPGLAVERDGQMVWSLAAANGLRGQASLATTIDGNLAIVATAAADGSDLEELDLKDHAVIAVYVGKTDGDASDANARRFEGARRNSRIARAVSRSGGTLVAIADDEAWQSSEAFPPMSRPGTGAGGPAGARRGNAPTRCDIQRSDLDRLMTALQLGRTTAGLTKVEKIVVPTARLKLDVKIEESQAPAWNVVAILPGSDPKLRDEYVGVGCHLDHLGIRNGVISPGADDDGSGSAGLLGIADAFVANGIAPKRSILFMAFCGEEMGLIGSAFFAKNPSIPLEAMIAELQIDMIGRNEEGERGEERAQDNLDCLHLVGTQKLSEELHSLCVARNDLAGFALEWDAEDVFFRSDHWNFAKHGVPIAFFFTGFHRDYHRPSDTVEKIDFGKLARVATYVYDIAFELAQGERRPHVDREKWEGLRGRGREVPAAPIKN
ncbi:MAG: M28 family peptidase [Planctomycetota bacterium]